jgi:hypothetical protein
MRHILKDKAELDALLSKARQLKQEMIIGCEAELTKAREIARLRRAVLTSLDEVISNDESTRSGNEAENAARMDARSQLRIEAEAGVVAATNSVNACLERKVQWEQMILADAMGRVLAEQKSGAELNIDVESAQDRQAAHALAMRTARNTGRGLLFYDYQSLHNSFFTFGGLIGVIVAFDLVGFHLGFHQELVLMIGGLLGGILGIVGGLWLYSRLFIEDPFFVEDHNR